MKIGVVSLGTKEITDYTQHTFAINREYCNRHGYKWIQFNETLCNRPASWSKLVALITQLRFYDWLFWIDANAAFADHYLKIESLLPDKKDFLISDKKAINCGVFAIKNTEWSERMLRVWYSMDSYTHYQWWENAPLIDMFNNNYPDIYKKTKFINKSILNSFYPGNWNGKNFIVHMPGETLGAREAFFDNLRKQLKIKV